MSDFADRLREERARLGLTQEQLGEAGGVKKQAQSLYEAGKRRPDSDYLERVSSVGVDTLYLLTGTRSSLQDYPTTPLATEEDADEGPETFICLDSHEPLEWRDVLIIAVDELRAAGLSLPGDKLAKVVDLLVEFQEHGLATTRDAIRKQLRLVA